MVRMVVIGMNSSGCLLKRSDEEYMELLLLRYPGISSDTCTFIFILELT